MKKSQGCIGIAGFFHQNVLVCPALSIISFTFAGRFPEYHSLPEAREMMERAMERSGNHIQDWENLHTGFYAG